MENRRSILREIFWAESVKFLNPRAGIRKAHAPIGALQKRANDSGSAFGYFAELLGERDTLPERHLFFALGGAIAEDQHHA